MFFRFMAVILVAVPLAGCATANNPAASTSAFVADAWPKFFGGMPSDVPPRRGTPEYDAWQAERAAEAARPKNVKQPN
jgi:hypothetical protein